MHCAGHQLFLVPCMYTITQFKYKYSGCMFLLEEELGYIHSMHPLRSLGTSSIRWISFSLSLLLNREEMSYLRTLYFSLLLNRGGGIDAIFEMALFIQKSFYKKFMTQSPPNLCNYPCYMTSRDKTKPSLVGTRKKIN